MVDLILLHLSHFCMKNENKKQFYRNTQFFISLLINTIDYGGI